MMHARTIARLACVAVATAGCSLDTGVAVPSAAVRRGESLQTDSLAYTATWVSGEGTWRRYGVRVVARYTNPTASTVYLARCFPQSPTPEYGVLLFGDTAAGGGFGSAFDPVWACVGHDQQLAVAAGATRTDTLLLRAPNAWQQGGAPLGRVAGRVRLVYTVGSCPGDAACPLPRSAGWSNVFDVTVEN